MHAIRWEGGFVAMRNQPVEFISKGFTKPMYCTLHLRKGWIILWPLATFMAIQAKMRMRVIRFRASPAQGDQWESGSVFFRELQYNLKSKQPPPKWCSKGWGVRSEDIYQVKTAFEDHSLSWALTVGPFTCWLWFAICLVANPLVENYNHLSLA